MVKLRLQGGTVMRIHVEMLVWPTGPIFAPGLVGDTLPKLDSRYMRAGDARKYRVASESGCNQSTSYDE